MGSIADLNAHGKRGHVLSPAEREVIITVADAEDHWTIFTDSARLTNRLLRIAEEWGVAPERLGAGYNFALPLKAIRFASPRRASSAQRNHLARLRAIKARSQKAHFVAAQSIEIGSAAMAKARAKADTEAAHPEKRDHSSAEAPA